MEFFLLRLCLVICISALSALLGINYLNNNIEDEDIEFADIAILDGKNQGFYRNCHVISINSNMILYTTNDGHRYQYSGNYRLSHIRRRSDENRA